MSELTKIKQSEKYPDETCSVILGNCYDKKTTAEIVHRCNTFDDLLKACKEALQFTKGIDDRVHFKVEQAIAKAKKS